MHNYITGIQQIGIGVKNVREAMLLYKALFGMNVLIFDDTSDAVLMTQYTGGVEHRRRAILTLNMAGGGGFEIWQFQNREALMPLLKPVYGDIGIFAAKIKCVDAALAHKAFSNNKNVWVSALRKNAKGDLSFWVKDAYENYFQIITCDNWFKKNINIGGVLGAVIGVSDMEASIRLYRDVLGINEIVYDVRGNFDSNPEGEAHQYRKVLLRKRTGGKGAFNKLLGPVEIELLQCLDRIPDKIYKNRYWGDCGFIHLCFDVLNMEALKAHAAQYGFHFTVDSNNSFAMEDAAGRFCYLEDPDGTLIELVETHKVPVLKKYGIYLNLKKRNIEKSLPDWIIKMLSLSKVK